MAVLICRSHQPAEAVRRTELRNGSDGRIGVRGEEEMGDGLKGLFLLEHRLDSSTGAQASPRFWEGAAIVGLEGRFGRITFGRDEHPAFTYSQEPGDPYRTYTVASNGSIVRAASAASATATRSTTGWKWVAWRSRPSWRKAKTTLRRMERSSPGRAASDLLTRSAH